MGGASPGGGAQVSGAGPTAQAGRGPGAERREAHLGASSLSRALEGPLDARLQRAGLTLQEGAAALHPEHLPLQQSGVG